MKNVIYCLFSICILCLFTITSCNKDEVVLQECDTEYPTFTSSIEIPDKWLEGTTITHDCINQYMVTGKLGDPGTDQGIPFSMRVSNTGERVSFNIHQLPDLLDVRNIGHLTSEQGYIIYGTALRHFSAENAPVFMIKIDFNGNLIESKYFNFANYTSTSISKGIKLESGNYAFIGRSEDALSGVDGGVYLLILDSNLNIVRENVLYGDEDVFGHDIHETGDGNISILIGKSGTGTAPRLNELVTLSISGQNTEVLYRKSVAEGFVGKIFSPTNSDIYTLIQNNLFGPPTTFTLSKFNSQGELLEQKDEIILDQDIGGIREAVITNSNDVVISTENNFLFKLGYNGELIWLKTIEVNDHSIQVIGINKTKDNGIAYTGISGFSGSLILEELFVARTDINGEF